MNAQDFINTIAPFAVQDMIKNKVLASVTIAQGALESAWGKSAPANNLFGIKGSGTTQTTKEFVNGQWITIQAGFRSYESWEGSINDHSLFLTENVRYANHGFFIACEKLDYKGATASLQNAGYATDPSYASLLNGIIETHQLYKYDTQAQEEIKMIEQLTAQIQALTAEVQKLKDYNAMPEIPTWAIDACNSAKKAGILDTPEGRSYDLYSTLTILHRKGVI